MRPVWAGAGGGRPRVHRGGLQAGTRAEGWSGGEDVILSPVTVFWSSRKQTRTCSQVSFMPQSPRGWAEAGPSPDASRPVGQTDRLPPGTGCMAPVRGEDFKGM